MTTASASWNFSRKRMSIMQVSSGRRPHAHVEPARPWPGTGHRARQNQVFGYGIRHVGSVTPRLIVSHFALGPRPQRLPALTYVRAADSLRLSAFRAVRPGAASRESRAANREPDAIIPGTISAFRITIPGAAGNGCGRCPFGTFSRRKVLMRRSLRVASRSLQGPILGALVVERTTHARFRRSLPHRR